MGNVRALSELSDTELFGIARLLVPDLSENNIGFLLLFAAELRKRGLTATEDYVLQMAARLDPNAPRI